MQKEKSGLNLLFFFSSHAQCSNFHDSFAKQMLLNVMVTFAVKSLGPDMGMEEYQIAKAPQRIFFE